VYSSLYKYSELVLSIGQLSNHLLLNKPITKLASQLVTNLLSQ